MSRVLVVNSRFPGLDAERSVLDGHEIVEAVCDRPEDIAAAAPDARAILITSRPRVTGEVMRAMPSLEVVCRYGIGVDNVDVEAASELGVVVCNVPDYAIDEVAGHAIALALALLRKVAAGVEATRSGAWSVGALHPVWDLRETIVGIVGFGAIGRCAAAKAAGLGMQVLVHDPFVDAADVERVPARAATLEELLAAADVVTLHTPLTPATRHMVDAAALARMKPTAYLVNTARGELIDEAALVDALDGRLLAGAGLDVLADEPPGPEHPLLGRPDVLVTPHMAWYSEQALARLQHGAAEQVRAVLAGEEPRHAVNRRRRARRPAAGPAA